MGQHKRERSSSSEEVSESSSSDDDELSRLEKFLNSSEDRSFTKQEVQPEDDSISADEADTNCVKSPQELRKDLRKLLTGLSINSGDFATGELLPDSELPNRPLIDVTGFGLLPFPMVQTTFEAIQSLCKQFSLGLGEEKLMDTSVKNSFQLDPSQFEIRNEMFVKQVDSLIQTKIKATLGLVGTKIFGKIYKLIIYEKGGRFDEGRDTDQKEENIFGTLIVQLPSSFEGGNLEVKHLNTSKVFENSSEGCATHCRFIAHYASCPSESQELTSGYQVALIYSLCWQGNGTKPSPYTASTKAVKLCKTLNMLTESSDVPFLCWDLENEYSDANMKQIAKPMTFFKGKDRNVIHGMKSALEYDRQIFGQNRWEICVATANKRIEEIPFNCKGTRKRRCKGNHDYFSHGRSFQVEGIIPLISKSSICKDLSKLDISPERDVINFPIQEIIPGQKRMRYDSYDEFWGTNDLGDGCPGAGYDEEETPIRERWYQKKVLVLWRCDHSLALRCWSSIDDAVTHVFSLYLKKEVVEDEEGFKYLWNNREKFEKAESFAKVLEMCNVLEDKDKAFVLLKDMKTSETTSGAIAETANRFCDNSILNQVKNMIRNNEKRFLYDVVQFCKQLCTIEPSEILQILVNHFLKEDDFNDLYRDFWDSSDPRSSPPTTIVLDYAFSKSVFTSSEIDRLIDRIHDFIDLESAITLTIDDDNVEVLNCLIVRYIKLYSEIEKHAQDKCKYKKVLKAGAKIVKALVVVPVERPELTESITTAFNIIADLPEKKLRRGLIWKFVQEIQRQYSSYGYKLPECLQKPCLILMESLKEIVSKGEPQMNWNQPNASVPELPDMEAFFKGPSESMVFGKGYFNSITEAKRWAKSHAKQKGCYMTLTPSGSGRNAVVTITKTTGGFEMQIAAFKAMQKEYNKLKNFVLKFKGEDVIALDKEVPDLINLNDKENQRTPVSSEHNSLKVIVTDSQMPEASGSCQ